MNRRRLVRHLSSAAALAAAFLAKVHPVQALVSPTNPSRQPASLGVYTSSRSQPVAYKPLSLKVKQFGNLQVPVACWFPVVDAPVQVSKAPLIYQHRISVRRIGQLLAGWDFIPDFVSKSYALGPTSPLLMDGTRLQLPSRAPVVLLAHGYLGSRFDLSHLAEKLAAEGFVCLAAEYPESLAASFDRIEGLDRRTITASLLESLNKDWNVQAESYGIVGHSLGCGTAIETGDDTWTRVCIAGFPRLRDGRSIPGKVLFLTSMNDGAVSLARFGGLSAIPGDFALLDEATLLTKGLDRMPSRAAIVFDRADAPNHISFLSEGVNDAMISFLSPLLPVAQAFQIPVLDFDRYQLSRDSTATAEVVHPIVTAYLKQQMMLKQG